MNLLEILRKILSWALKICGGLVFLFGLLGLLVTKEKVFGLFFMFVGITIFSWHKLPYWKPKKLSKLDNEEKSITQIKEDKPTPKNKENKVFNAVKQTTNKSNSPNSPKDFTIIDFETTGLKYVDDEIIEIGAIKVRDLKIVDTYSTLCNPLEPITNSHIHGITDEDVREYKHSKEYVGDLLNFIDNDIIFAYNAPFDMTFLNVLLDKNVENKIVDVLDLARKYDIRDSYKLENIKTELEFEVESHRAVSDCGTTLQYYKYLLENKNIQKVDFMAFKNGLDSLRIQKSSKLAKKIMNSYTPDLSCADENHPFYGKKVCFTGALNSIGREAACLKVLDLGGETQTGVTMKTDFLVVGYYETITSKELKARDYNERKNLDIKIIDEDEFLELISE